MNHLNQGQADHPLKNCAKSLVHIPVKNHNVGDSSNTA